MANLILKPSTGGVLKIQNQDGTVDAITVSTAGNLTAAGNTTLSGTANNLGTVTAGTFPVPSATALYPTGHVLQVVSYYTTAQGSITYTTSDQVVNGMTKDITPKGANSKFLVAVRVGGEGPNQWNKSFNIQMDGTRVNVPTSGLGALGTKGVGLGIMTEGHQGTNNDSTPEFMAFSTLVSTSSVIGTDITFRLVTAGTETDTSYFNRCVGVNNEEFSSELIITEIKG
jgi:hypothetical protein